MRAALRRGDAAGRQVVQGRVHAASLKYTNKGVEFKEGNVTSLYLLTEKVHKTLNKDNGAFTHTWYNKDERGRLGSRYYTCTPKQAEQLVKAYKDAGVYLIEGNDTDTLVVASGIAPCPPSDDEN